MRAILMLLAGFAAAADVGASTVPADVLVYSVSEDGAEPYESRILVTPDFLRLDEGEDSAAFTLFDRRSRILYNLDPEDRLVVVIDPPTTLSPEPPIPLELGEETELDPGLPPVDGALPKHVRLLANGVVCVDVIAAPGLMDEAVTAIGDFHERLAHQHALAMEALPPELLDACDLAENVYAPRRTYDHGLPLHLWSQRFVRKLERFERAMAMDASLFSIPRDYRQVPLGKETE